MFHPNQDMYRLDGGKHTIEVDILPRIEARSNWDMAALCDAQIDCVGFVMENERGGGYLKKVLLDQSEWKTQAGSAAACKGLFIKGTLDT